MAWQLERHEGTSARRIIPFKVFTSDGTSPETGFSNATVFFSIIGSGQNVSAASASAISAAAGLYSVELTASELSTLGNMIIYTDAVGAEFSQHVASVQIVNNNLFSTFSSIGTIPGVTNVDAKIGTVASLGGGATLGQNLADIAGGTFDRNNDSLEQLQIDIVNVQSDTDDIQTRLPAALVGGRMDANTGAISGDATAADNLEAAFDGTGYVSTMTTRGLTNYSNLSGTFSDLTVQVENTVTLTDASVTAAKFSAGAIDAAALATDAGQEIADRVLARNIGGGSDTGRVMSEAMAALRNRVALSAVSLIVYDENDTDILWHGSLSTADTSVFPTEVNPD